MLCVLHFRSTIAAVLRETQGRGAGAAASRCQSQLTRTSQPPHPPHAAPPLAATPVRRCRLRGFGAASPAPTARGVRAAVGAYGIYLRLRTRDALLRALAALRPLRGARTRVRCPRGHARPALTAGCSGLDAAAVSAGRRGEARRAPHGVHACTRVRREPSVGAATDMWFCAADCAQPSARSSARAFPRLLTRCVARLRSSRGAAARLSVRAQQTHAFVGGGYCGTPR
jgi:hypothetical protein